MNKQNEKKEWKRTVFNDLTAFMKRIRKTEYIMILYSILKVIVSPMNQNLTIQYAFWHYLERWTVLECHSFLQSPILPQFSALYSEHQDDMRQLYIILPKGYSAWIHSPE